MEQREYREIRCRDTGVDCDFMVRAETENEAIRMASAHACRAHSRCENTPEMEESMKAIARSVWREEGASVRKEELQSPPGEWMED